MACQPVGEVLVHGNIAIEAVRAAAKGKPTEEKGMAYGLRAARDALAFNGAVYCFFVHPQMLLPGWAGGKTADAQAKARFN